MKKIYRYQNNQLHSTQDHLATEEPLEIRINYGTPTNRFTKNISVTMRTPGADEALSIGFLYTEGIVTQPSQVQSIRYAKARSTRAKDNIIVIELAGEVILNLKKLERNFYLSSSCGVCGKASIEAIHTCEVAQRMTIDWQVAPSILETLPDKLRAQQAIFEQTGGLHAAALFDREGNIMLLNEDVGRHNALDKVIGNAFLDSQLPLKGRLLLVSGRLSFELVQKAVMAGVELVAAVGAPSSLAVDLAEEMGVTLVGFLKKGRFNIYTHPDRIVNK